MAQRLLMQRRIMQKRSSHAELGLALVLSLVVGCVDRLGDIDQREPHAVEKSMFVGEWYFRHYIADVSSLAAEDFEFIPKVGMHPERVRWEIHEDELTAISVVETLPGREGHDPTVPIEETIVARYPIVSHFDVRREFDPQTGEESNVLVEDTTTRRWYERTHIRVDWSHNQAENWLFETFESVDARTEVTEGSPDDDRYALDIAEDHINVVSEYTTNVDDALSSRVRVVTSAARVPESDYQPFDVPFQQQLRDENGEPLFDDNGDPRMVDVGSRFGILTTERQSYDRRIGELWQNRQYLANRHNLFQRWTDDSGNLIPLEDREIRPILYVLNEDYPSEYVEPARHLAEIWNQAFVQVLTDVGYPADRIGRVFDVCENPITTDSSPECQTLGLGPKIHGDVRYHFLAVHRGTGFDGLLGVAQTHPDPITGMSVASTATGFASTFEYVADQALQMVKAIQGVIDPESPEWVHGTVFGSAFGASTDPGEARIHATNTEAAHWIEQMRSTFEPLRDPTLPIEFDAHRDQMRRFSEGLRGHSALELALENTSPRIDPLQHTGPSPEGLRNAVHAYRQPLDPSLPIEERIRLRTEATRMLSENHAHVIDYINPTMTFLAERMARKYTYPERGTPDYAARVAEIDAEIFGELLSSVYMATMLHEVGHALGLDHNFAANFDEYNFIQPGVTTPVLADSTAGGEELPEVNGYWDVVTSENDDLAFRAEFQYSSIMDYAGAISGDFRGLGAYDLAAIRFGYLNHIEAYESGHPALAEEEALDDGMTTQEAKQAAYEVIQHRRFVPFEPANIVGDARSGLERIQVGDELLYVNRYKFCNDTFADGFDLECTRHDVGRDLLESVSIGLDIARQNYVFRNLARGRVSDEGSINFGVILGTLDSLTTAMRAGQLASFYAQLFDLDPATVFSADPSQLGFLQEYYLVAAYGLNEIVNIMNTPEAGAYTWTPEGLYPLLYVPPGVRTVALAESDYVRPVDSDYTRGVGEWSEVSRFGYFNNRIGAILSLVLGFNLNLEEVVGSSLPPGLGSLSLGNLFPAETVELLFQTLAANSSVTQEYFLPSALWRPLDRYAALPVMEDGILRRAEDVAPPGATATSVMPSNRVLMDVAQATHNPMTMESSLETMFGSWESVPKVYSLHQGEELQWFLQWAMSELPTASDLSWQRYLRVHQAGDLFSHDYPEESERLVEWTDEGTGITWQAYRYDSITSIDGGEVDPSLGARFLEWITASLTVLPPDAHEAFLDEVRYKLDFWYSLQRL